MLLTLPQLGIIQISGEQAKEFLQGQLTCNLNEVDAEHSRLGLYCDAKGRALTDFRLYFNTPQSYSLVLHHSLIEKTILQLKKYAVFSKLKIENNRFAYQILGYLPDEPRGETSIDTLLSKLPSAVDQCIINKQTVILSVPGLQARYLIILPATQAITGCQDAQESQDRWQREDILAGIPSLEEKTSELFTPHMINYHLINGVSFNKGCFMGQEIIARTQHLASIKRRMYRFHVISEQSPLATTAIFNKEQAVGIVMNSHPNPQLEFGYHLLAVIYNDTFIDQDLSLGPDLHKGAALIKKELPYCF